MNHQYEFDPALPETQMALVTTSLRRAGFFVIREAEGNRDYLLTDASPRQVRLASPVVSPFLFMSDQD